MNFKTVHSTFTVQSGTLDLTGSAIFIQIAAVSCVTKHNQIFNGARGWHFLRKGVQNLQKVTVDKTVTPLFWHQKFYDPHLRYTLPLKQAKIVLKSVFLNKINTLSVTPYILVIKNFDPPIFFPKIYDPQYIWDPPSEENASPGSMTRTLQRGQQMHKQLCFIMRSNNVMVCRNDSNHLTHFEQKIYDPSELLGTSCNIKHKTHKYNVRSTSRQGVYSDWCESWHWERYSITTRRGWRYCLHHW